MVLRFLASFLAFLVAGGRYGDVATLLDPSGGGLRMTEVLLPSLPAR
jgi:hypothetical protein